MKNTENLGFLDRYEETAGSSQELSAALDSFLTDGQLGLSVEDFEQLCLDESPESVYLDALGYSFDMDKKTVSELKREGRWEARELDPTIYESDPFYQAVQGLRGHSGDIHISMNRYLPLEGFICEDISSSGLGNLGEKNVLGFFTTEFPYLVLRLKNRVWMSSTPFEMNTMKAAIEKATGKVTTLGLGLGYYAYSCALKPEVSKVVAIESDPRVIDVWDKLIKPRLGPACQKIEVVCSDAFAYLRSGAAKDSDTLFADLWHTGKDGLEDWAELLNLEEQTPNAKHDYWILGSIIAYLRRLVFQAVDSALWQDDDSDIIGTLTDFEKKVYRKAAACKISDADELEKLLSDQGLIELVRSLTSSSVC